MSEESQTVALDEELEALFTQLDALPIGKAATLVKAMEERWGVSAAAPVAVAAAAGGGEAEAAEEKTEFDVVLESFGEKKIDEGISRLRFVIVMIVGNLLVRLFNFGDLGA